MNFTAAPRRLIHPHPLKAIAPTLTLALTAALVATLTTATVALAQSYQPRILTDEERAYVVAYPGVGGFIGMHHSPDSSGGRPISDAGITLGGSVHGRNNFYGMAAGRLQLGNTSGVHVSSIAGYNIMPTSDILLIGFEPTNIYFNETRQAATRYPQDTFTWNPMFALGVNSPSNNLCRVVAVARGGFFLSDIRPVELPGEEPAPESNRFNVGGAYGFGAYINCDLILDIAMSITRLHYANRPIDIVQSEVQIPLNHMAPGVVGVSLGLRAEYLNLHQDEARFLFEMPGNYDRTELRLFLMISVRQELRN